MSLGEIRIEEIYHMASLVNPKGEISALCYKRPHAIDLSKACWTLCPEDVTCPRCRKILREQRQTPGGEG